MKYLLLLCITSMLFSANLKRDNSREEVLDESTKLVWMDNIDVVRVQMSHKKAVPYCENLSFAGKSTWRIPTLDEFKTIVDKSNEKTYINEAFKYNVPTGYWALKAHIRTFWFYADYMNFVSGTGYYDNRNKDKFIRCVRNK